MVRSDGGGPVMNRYIHGGHDPSSSGGNADVAHGQKCSPPPPRGVYVLNLAWTKGLED